MNKFCEECGKPIRLEDEDILGKLSFVAGDSFIERYTQIRSIFEQADRFKTFSGETHGCKNLPWPDGVGVYVLWMKERQDPSDVIYIGMTGKYKRADDGTASLADKKDGFQKRGARYHPYSFTTEGPWKDHYEFAPRHSMKDFLKVPFEDRYNQHIPIRDISIDCFIINQEMVIAPTYLESLLLQTYLSFASRLPTANNEL
jgi:hypothetical protein